MAKLLSFTLITLAISLASAAPAPNLAAAHPLESELASDFSSHSLSDVSIDGFSRRHFVQTFDDDAVDAKNLNLNVNALNSAPGNSKGASSKGSSGKTVNHHHHLHSGSSTVQSSDDDLVDLQDLKTNVNVLNSNWKRKGDYLGNYDQDLLHYKGHHRSLHEGLRRQQDGYDHAVEKMLFLDRSDGAAQSSDNDGIDAKDLSVNVDALNSVRGIRSVIEDEDDDLSSVKKSRSDPDTSHHIIKRSDIDKALDVLRRADYNVDSLTKGKRSESGMWQYDEGDHTCYCAKKSSCASDSPSKSLKVSATPTLFAPTRLPIVHHHQSYVKASDIDASSSIMLPQTQHHHHHHSSTSASTSTAIGASTTLLVEKPRPTHYPAHTCPSGYTKAGRGEVMQSSDNDLADLKNLVVNINVLNSEGKETSKKTVSASKRPICEGAYCCYAPQKAGKSVTQKSDDDVLDLKKTSLGLSLLNGIL
ncbi:hypothetical protein CBS101457_002076 [Exobasidium rhododendri]|nr:hypothetical protein CBS101457_002076 [Exobasidium rhododendri]